MRDVMMKAQELAEAILDSGIYQKMKEKEREVRQDPVAGALLEDMLAKRQQVENILSSTNMKPEELSQASLAMEEAEKKMNSDEKIIALKAARKDFQTMMDNVNQILRLVVTGKVEDSSSEGCNGNCASCGGCH